MSSPNITAKQRLVLEDILLKRTVLTDAISLLQNSVLPPSDAHDLEEFIISLTVRLAADYLSVASDPDFRHFFGKVHKYLDDNARTDHQEELPW